MKTYSRKNSSYLKKAFIASNFNEMCRLCLSELDLGLTPIFQEFSKISYQEWIQYSVDVLIEEGDGLPPNICEECLGLVEQTYLFKKKCQASDSKLREHLELLDLNKGEKLTETGLIDLTEDHINLFQREEQSKSKCDESSAVDSGGTCDTPSNEEQPVEEVLQIQPAEEQPAKEQPAEAQPAEEQQVEEQLGEDQPGEEVSQKEPAEEQPKKEILRSELVEIKKEHTVENTETQSLYSDVEFEYIEPQEKVVKRYILRGEKKADDQEEDLTVCEVVPLDARNEDTFSSDMEETLTYTTLECPRQNGHASEFCNPQEMKIQEIYQLWDNEEEGEEDEEGEKDESGIMVLDVSWEDNTDNNEKRQNMGLLEVDVEQNGVVQLHRVYTNRRQSEASETKLDMKTFTKVEAVNFKCFACGKDFLTGVELKAHLSKFHHEVSDAAFCETCGKSFVCINNLKRHMGIHTGYKPHKCKICGRTFSQLSILKRHVFTHETLKPFNCQICGKGYTQKMNLLSHFRNHGFRTEGESFSCQYCNKTFVHQSGLSRHVRLHKGVRFSCDHCDKTFGDSSALARHIKAIHSNK